MKKLKKEVGNWVDGKKFWDREIEIRRLIELLDEGANVLITAQRRIGKTSLIRESERRLKGRYICLQLDLQKCHSPADFVAELSIATLPYLNLWGKTKAIFKNILGIAMDRIETIGSDELTIKLRNDLSENWQIKGDRIFEVLAKSEKPVIVFMDEFPLFINRTLKGTDYTITPERLQKTDQFLSWIRAATIKHKGKVRLVIAGSIGLEPILRQARLSAAMTTFTPFDLKAWDKETALGCLEALANNYGIHFQAGTKEHILEHLNCCIPHHVQMFFSYIYDYCKRRNKTSCNLQEVNYVYETYMLSIRGHAELSTFEERLKIVLGDEMMPFALDLLTEAAVSGRLTAESAKIISKDHIFRELSPQKALMEILNILEHDGYLERKESGYVFISKLLREWWKARFGFGFTPALERDK
jgi:uncharacterized protein